LAVAPARFWITCAGMPRHGSSPDGKTIVFCGAPMNIADAQRELRLRFTGGFYGQAVSAVLWLASASLATWSTPGRAMALLVIGGFFIFPLTELLIRAAGTPPLKRENALSQLGMQVAFVLPFSMPLLVPIVQFRQTLFYPAMMILLGAHYIPFVFLYGMRMFAVLAAVLLGGGIMTAMYFAKSFSTGAWYSAVVLLVFAIAGRVLVRREIDNV
jgi:hypothetical protein